MLTAKFLAAVVPIANLAFSVSFLFSIRLTLCLSRIKDYYSISRFVNTNILHRT